MSEKLQSQDVIQGSKDWHEAKRGKISGSQISNILMNPSTAGYQNYLTRLALERITNITEETFCSNDMQRGLDLEDSARTIYEFSSGNEVTQLGYIEHPYVEMALSSPDGVVGSEGGVEIKCPKAKNHLETRLTEKIKREYLLQVQWLMACSPSIQWVDYISFCPDFPADLQLKIIRVWRDDHKIDELEAAAIKFNRAVEQTVADILAS